MRIGKRAPRENEPKPEVPDGLPKPLSWTPTPLTSEELTVDWAKNYAKNYWKFGREPETQAALALLTHALDQAEADYEEEVQK